MKNGRYSLEKISTLPKRNIFFDANILIHLFWPTITNSVVSNKYSTAFRSLLNVKFTLVTSSLIISEVINRCLRIEYSKFLTLNELTIQSFPFKEYRKSEQGILAQKDVFIIIKDQVLKFLHITDKSYKNKEIFELLKVDQLDFNDKLILSNCIDCDYLLFTHDEDFKNSPIDILTLNTAILK